MQSVFGMGNRGGVIIWLVLAGIPWVAVAETARASDVSDVRGALADQPDLPWYDAEKDDFKPAEVEPTTDDPARRSDWASTVANRQRGTGDRGGTLLARVLQVLAWLLLGTLLVALLAVLVWSALRVESRSADTEPPVPEDDPEPGRLDRLPVPVTRSEQDLLETARMYRRSGEYGWAVIYLFAHMLVELDKHQLIRLTRGKTNRQYLLELGLRSPLSPIVQQTMVACEDTFFGQHVITEQRLQECWQGLEPFQQYLVQENR